MSSTTNDSREIDTRWLPRDREEARAKGFKTYLGKRCVQGLHRERYVRDGKCAGCQRAQVRRWKAAHPEKHRESVRRWEEANPDRAAAINGKKGAERRAPGCTPEHFDIEATIPLYAEARRLTEETGIPHHVDHAIALSLGGQHRAENLRVVTAEDNVAKGVIERRLVEAVNSDSPMDELHRVFADVKAELADLVGITLRNQIYSAALRIAKQREAELRNEGVA